MMMKNKCDKDGAQIQFKRRRLQIPDSGIHHPSAGVKGSGSKGWPIEGSPGSRKLTIPLCYFRLIRMRLYTSVMTSERSLIARASASFCSSSSFSMRLSNVLMGSSPMKKGRSPISFFLFSYSASKAARTRCR